MTATPGARGVLDTSTIILLRRIRDRAALPLEPLITAARLEAAERNPSFETLCRLSSALGIQFLVTSPRRVKAQMGEREGRAVWRNDRFRGSQVLIAAAS